MKCCDFKASDFRTTVELQARSRVADGQGGWSEGWVAVRKLVCKWAKTGGQREQFKYEQRQAMAAHVLFARYSEPLPDASMRIVYKGKAYNIVGVTDVEMLGRIMEIHLSEGVAP